MLFDGHVVFITGGSSGIGAALGRAFAREGARVALFARNQARLDEAVASCGAGDAVIGLAGDVTSRESIDGAVAETVERFGKIDVAVANAGFGVSGPFERLTTEDFRRQFDTNVFGAIDTAYACLPELIEHKGRLVFVSSVFGKMGGPTTSAYCASKFALCGLTESIHYELAAQGVSVTCINPGVIASNFRAVDNRNRLREGRKEPLPQWIVMDTDKAARQMVRGIYRRRYDVTITRHGKLADSLHRHFPRLFRFVFGLMLRGRMDQFERARRGPAAD